MGLKEIDCEAQKWIELVERRTLEGHDKKEFIDIFSFLKTVYSTLIPDSAKEFYI